MYGASNDAPAVEEPAVETPGEMQQMLTFKESFNEVVEAKLKLPKGEKVAKELTKLGKKKECNCGYYQQV